MHHVNTRGAKRTTHRSSRPSLSPYFVEDVAFTLSDVVAARTDDSGLLADR